MHERNVYTHGPVDVTHLVVVCHQGRNVREHLKGEIHDDEKEDEDAWRFKEEKSRLVFVVL
jgi:hypothetical protein